MTERIIQNARELEAWVRFLQSKKFPMTVSQSDGRDRSLDQNKLQRLWINEIAEQLGDSTPEEIRGFCKLTIAVPILRAEDEDFREAYDRVIRPMPYEDKLACMMEPIDFPVTRRMKVRQMVKFLDEMQRYWGMKGIILTEPSSDLADYNKRYRQPEARAA